MMASKAEQDAYFAARNRAMERIVEGPKFQAELTDSFSHTLYLLQHSDPNVRVAAELIEPETNVGFAMILAGLARVEAIKGKGYLASCFKRGMQGGLLPNLERKMDRVSALINDNAKNEGGGESLTENLADLAVYAIKGITLQSTLNPEEVEKWIEGVKNLS
jgi:hypothetical protein